MEVTSLLYRLRKIGYSLVAKRLPPNSYPLVGKLCRRVRCWFMRKLAIECGRDVDFGHGTSVAWESGIRIGDYSGLGSNCSLDGPLTMGQHVMMGPEVLVFRRNHVMERTDVPMKRQGGTERRLLVICDDVWIGQRVIITAGCGRIGRGAIIGAAAVVTKDVPDYAIVAGNPGRIVKTRQLTHDPTGEAKLTLPSGVVE